MTKTIQTTTANLNKFVASITDVNPGFDILIEDFTDMVKKEGNDIVPVLEHFVLEALTDEDFTGLDEIFVVGSDLEVVQQIADALNGVYEKEYRLAATRQTETLKRVTAPAREAVKQVEEAIASATPTKPEGEKNMTKANTTKSAKAAAFLKKHSTAIKNAQKAPEKKEEAAPVKEAAAKPQGTKVVVSQNNASTKTKGENKMTNTQNTAKGNQETKVAPSRRMPSNAPKADVAAVKEGTGGTATPSRRMKSSGASSKVTVGGRGAGRLERTESVTNKFVAFDGPWYLNPEFYPVLNRFESIIETMSDKELGIEQIALVDPEQFVRYDKKPEVFLVIQVKANGVVLEFPIKDNRSETSKADLSSNSINWIKTKNGMRPVFGFWRGNSMEVQATCTCGNEIEKPASNMYCNQCRTAHPEVVVEMEHALKFEVPGAVFQQVPNLTVNTDILALVMAIAQYDSELPMHGVIEE